MSSAISKKSNKRIFSGETHGGLVAEYLNQDDRPADDPVQELIERFQDPRLDPHEVVRFSREVVKKRPHLELKTLRVLKVNSVLRTVEVDEVPVVGDGEGPLRISAVASQMMLAWNRCFILIHRRLLDRIRQCKQCSKWFYGRFSHSAFHDDTCRVAFETTNPEYKERRREYARKVREQEKKGRKKT
jgi:hypothetical protein